MTKEIMGYLTQEERCIIYEDGHIYVTEDLSTPGAKKSKIVRNSFLPKWVREGLGQGQVIEVTGLEVGKSADGGRAFPIVRGRAISPSFEEEKVESVYSCSDKQYVIKKIKTTDIYKVRCYGSVKERVERLSSTEEILYGYLQKDYKNLPLPEKEVEYSEEVLGVIERITLSEDKKTLQIIEEQEVRPHTKGFYYGYNFQDSGSEFIPVLKKEPIADNWCPKYRDLGKREETVISLEVLKAIEEEGWSSSYPSNDGMRMCRDRIKTRTSTVKIKTEGGEYETVIIENL